MKEDALLAPLLHRSFHCRTNADRKIRLWLIFFQFPICIDLGKELHSLLCHFSILDIPFSPSRWGEAFS
jgi:hypothetical protein